MVFIHIWREK